MAQQKRKKRYKHPVKRFIRNHFELCAVLFVLVVLLGLFLIGFGIYKLFAGSSDSPKDPAGPTTTLSPTDTVRNDPTPTPGEPTGTPEPTPMPTATPTPKLYGINESVTTDVDAEPIPGDNWPVDYLMLVNWEHRLKYSGNPENLVRLDEILTESWYTIQNPGSVAEKSRDFVIVTDEDNYDRGNRVALTYLDQMCKGYHAETGFGVKVSQTGAYRNYATQDKFWNNRDRSINPPRTIPGNASEHRTGLGFDIWVLDKEKYDYTWFRNNCYKYGFILRYPSDKSKITGITYEQWHFRYVGVEAATEMHELKYCLEEYIAYKNGQDLSTLPKH